MLFNSIEFLIFLPLAAAVYFLLKDKFRVAWLLLCSCYFYMVFVPAYILILAVTIVVDYVAGILIERTSGKKKKFYLILSIVSNVGFLAFFKYFNFFGANLNNLAAFLDWNYSVPLLSIILPVGLSFHTFQALSYTIEVYRGRQKAEKHFLTYALYVMFFPQLVAGPIERPQNLLRQFYEHHALDFERVGSGVKLIIWGLFKKMVVADRIAPFVDLVYKNIHSYSGPAFLGATLLFAFQIYYDFSAYTDIARGSARILGFELMQNFNRPYASGSISEFWKRWHISLSSWFKDYVYIPLGGNRVKPLKMYFNLMVVFLLSGLWHGANWTFVVWGLLNGFYLVVSRITLNLRGKVRNLTLGIGLRMQKFISWLWVFILINLGWIFFRSESLSDAKYILAGLPFGWASINSSWLSQNFLNLVLVILGIALVEFVEWKKLQITSAEFKYRSLALPAMVALAALIFVFGSFQNRQFIYFQF